MGSAKRASTAVLCVSSALLALGTASGQPRALADEITLELKPSEELALKDVAVGKLDALLSPVDPPLCEFLPQATRDALFQISVSSGALSLLTNPAPGGPPYLTRDAAGKERFNVMAIKEFRQAFNRLVDREAVASEISLARGLSPRYTAGALSTAAADCERIALEMGFLPRGDGDALKTMETALRKAADLPELRGRLARQPSSWTFDGEPVTVRILARADDVSRRLRIGRYVASLMERAGLLPELLAYESSRCFKMKDERDPALLEWQVYTELWAGGNGEYIEQLLAQMYSPSFLCLPGGLRNGFWNYRHAELEDLGKRAASGQQMTRAEYERDRDRLVRLGLDESVRIFLAANSFVYVANRERLGGPPLYDLNFGFETWLPRSASPRPAEDGRRVLRLGLCSKSLTSFLQTAWDPLGAEGFCTNAAYILGAMLADEAFYSDPGTGEDADGACRLVDADGGAEEGMALPASARVWDGVAHGWRAPRAGERSRRRLVLEYASGPWHSGASAAVADAIHRAALYKEWCSSDGDDDMAYDSQIADLNASTTDPIVAIEPISASRIALYLAAGWDFDSLHLAWLLAPRARYVPWEVAEAICLLVLEGSASGARYSFTSSEDAVLPDLLRTECVADIASKLEQMLNRRYVPLSLHGIVDEKSALERYDKAIAFIGKHGHAFIGNGPFYLARVGEEGGYFSLAAFPSYPLPADYWYRRFARELPRTGAPRHPAAAAGRDLDVEVPVAISSFPEGASRAADASAIVRVSLVGPRGERSWRAEFIRPGHFRATISASDLAALGNGRYILVAEARIGDGPPSVSSSVLDIAP